MRIGEYVASLIEDRSTLQMGIGSISDAVLRCLANHKDLGVHTECAAMVLLIFLKRI
jgi:acyl-CoA hydrolase